MAIAKLTIPKTSIILRLASKTFISSTTKCKSNPEESFKEFSKDYKYICLDYNLNRNESYLQF